MDRTHRRRGCRIRTDTLVAPLLEPCSVLWHAGHRSGAAAILREGFAAQLALEAGERSPHDRVGLAQQAKSG